MSDQFLANAPRYSRCVSCLFNLRSGAGTNHNFGESWRLHNVFLSKLAFELHFTLLFLFLIPFFIPDI